MLDRVPLYPGRVKLTPVSGQENVYDMVRADQPTQPGDPLSKNTLFSDDAASFYPGASLPSEALKIIGRFNLSLGNEYLWHKTKQTETIEEYSEGDTSGTLRTSITHYYADSVEYDVTKPYKATLKNPQKYTYSMDTVDSLVGKYITNGDPSIQTPYKITEITAKYSSSANWSGEITGLKKVSSVEDFGFLNSPDSDAYPPSVSDGYEYLSMGQLGDKTRIVTGSYVGTGTYGEDNPNSLTFDYLPKILFVYGYSAALDRADAGFIWINEHPIGYTFYLSGNTFQTKVNVTCSGNVVSWYGNSASFQANTKNYIYPYFSIF